MTEGDRKRLTEWLGECWHDMERGEGNFDPTFYYWKCRKCGTLSTTQRTFTTPDDMMACKDRLVELGLFQKFEDMAGAIWWKGPDEISFANWLLNPERFCNLCVDFLKEREG